MRRTGRERDGGWNGACIRLPYGTVSTMGRLITGIVMTGWMDVKSARVVVCWCVCWDPCTVDPLSFYNLWCAADSGLVSTRKNEVASHSPALLYNVAFARFLLYVMATGMHQGPVEATSGVPEEARSRLIDGEGLVSRASGPSSLPPRWQLGIGASRTIKTFACPN